MSDEVQHPYGYGKRGEPRAAPRFTELDRKTLFLPGTRLVRAVRVQLPDGTDTIVTQDADGRWEDTAAGFTSPAVDAARAHYGEESH